MSALKLYPVTTPTSATQVSSTSQPVKMVIMSSSNASTFSFGDKTLTTAASGVVVAANSLVPVVLGSADGTTSFNINELYVFAASGNVNVLAVLL